MATLQAGFCPPSSRNGNAVWLLAGVVGAILIGLVPGPFKFAALAPALLAAMSLGGGRPALAILCAVLVIPFNFESLIARIGIPFVNPFNLVWLMALAFLLLYRHSRRLPLFDRTPLDAVIVLNIIVNTVALGRVHSLVEGGGFIDIVMVYQQWLQWVFGFWITAASLRSRREARGVTLAIAGMVLVAALFGIKDYIMTSAVSGGGIERSQGLFNQANYAASFFAYYIPILLALLLAEKRRLLRPVMLVIVVAAVTACVLTFGRGGLMALGIACLVLLILTRSRQLLLGLLLGIVLIAGDETVRTRFDETTGESGSSIELDSSSAARLIAWRKAGRLIRERPLFGWGFFAFRHVERSEDAESAALFGHGGMDVHNGHLNTAVSGGLVGSICLYLLFGRVIFWSLGIRRRTSDPFVRALAAGIVATTIAILVVNLTGTRLYDRQLMAYYWIFLGLLFGADRHAATGSVDTGVSDRTGGACAARPRPGLRQTGGSLEPSHGENLRN
ncbi:MAG: O-antigen ligase family protein [bacterium]|nr:O-antigen ligase family protein [bacterium]